MRTRESPCAECSHVEGMQETVPDVSAIANACRPRVGLPPLRQMVIPQ